MNITATVTYARAQSRDGSPLEGWDRFIEDHDQGDADPSDRVLTTFVLDTKRKEPK